MEIQIEREIEEKEQIFNTKIGDQFQENFHFSVQFYRVYLKRYKILSELYQAKRPQHVLLNKQLKSEGGQKVIQGIIIKKMAKVASFIKEREDPLFEEFLAQPLTTSWSPEDIVYLEDESGKVELDPKSSFRNQMDMKLSVQSFNTGNFIRVKGVMQSNFKFFVDEIEFLHLEPANKTSQLHPMLLISGLNLDHELFLTESYAKLSNFLQLENPLIFDDLKTVVIFGGIFNCLKQLNIHQYGNYHQASQYKARALDLEKQCRVFDKLVDGLSAILPRETKVIVQPALHDPVTSSVPQEKFDRILFQTLSQNFQVEMARNPSEIESSKIISGDIYANYSNYSDLSFQDSVKLNLLLGQLCPNCPNQIELAIDMEEELILKELPQYLIVSSA